VADASDRAAPAAPDVRKEDTQATLRDGSGPAAPAASAADSKVTPQGAPAASEPKAEEPIRHSYNLQNFGHLVGTDGSGAEHLHSFADTMAGAGATEPEVHAVLGLWSRASAGESVSWNDYAKALGGDSEKISDLITWFAERVIADDSPPTPEDWRAARAYAAQLPPEVVEGLHTFSANGKAPGQNAKVAKLLAAWHLGIPLRRASARSENPPPGSNNDRAAIEDELRQLQTRMGAPKGSPEWRSYWREGGEKRYRELLAQRDGGE
jgi:hypothetical protein